MFVFGRAKLIALINVYFVICKRFDLTKSLNIEMRYIYLVGDIFIPPPYMSYISRFFIFPSFSYHSAQ